MDYYQGVVVEYLRADRSVFVNTECCIELNPESCSAFRALHACPRSSCTPTVRPSRAW
jgi:hypothetical protein